MNLVPIIILSPVTGEPVYLWEVQNRCLGSIPQLFQSIVAQSEHIFTEVDVAHEVKTSSVLCFQLSITTFFESGL